MLVAAVCVGRGMWAAIPRFVKANRSAADSLRGELVQDLAVAGYYDSAEITWIATSLDCLDAQAYEVLMNLRLQPELDVSQVLDIQRIVQLDPQSVQPFMHRMRYPPRPFLLEHLREAYKPGQARLSF